MSRSFSHRWTQIHADKANAPSSVLICGGQMRLVKIRVPDFDLEKTLDSGQVFHWRKAGNGFVGTIGDDPIYVEQRGIDLRAAFELDGSKPSSLVPIVARYFALDH